MVAAAATITRSTRPSRFPPHHQARERGRAETDQPRLRVSVAIPTRTPAHTAVRLLPKRAATIAPHPGSSAEVREVGSLRVGRVHGGSHRR